MFRTSLMVAFFAGTALLALAQQQAGTLQVRGFDGEAGVIRVDGRPFVDLEALVRITGASVSFEGGSAVLSLPPVVPDAGTPAGNGFSRGSSVLPSRPLPPCASGVVRWWWPSRMGSR